MENDKVCTLIINGDTKVQPSPMDMQKKIEQASSVYMQKKDATKLVDALEELLLFMVNGNSYPRLLMTMIRFVITCDDHRVKKLLALYWEICDKVKDNGELKEEMVLVCNAIRNDLIHANEYIRGRTLRSLCRMRHFKIMEPLIESILKNLSHRHAYVRRNAVTCVYAVVKTFGVEVIPQAAVEIEQLLLVEGDLSTKRIAFIMLLNCDIDRAINYALSVEEQVGSLGDVFQLALLELVRKAAKVRPSHKQALMRLVFYLASGSSPAVTFESAEILSQYGTSPSAAQIAAGAYVSLLNSQPDNNVKLVVIEKLERMLDSQPHVVEAQAMDVLRALGCPALGVRRKVIALTARCLNSKNVQDIVHLLKKEIVKCGAPETTGADGNDEYRRLLIVTLQEASRRFPEFAESVVVTLADLLRDPQTDQSISYEIVNYLREVVCVHSALRDLVLDRLGAMLPDMARSRVIRTSLWLLGEFTLPQNAPAAIRIILDCLAPLPITVAAGKLADVDFDKDLPSTGTATHAPEEKMQISTKTVVLADGTYASQAVYGAKPVLGSVKKASQLRTLVRAGDSLLCSVVGVVLAKLYMKSNGAVSTQTRNEILFAITCMVRIVKSVSNQPLRLMQALRVIAEPDNKAAWQTAANEWLSDACRESLLAVVVAESSIAQKPARPVSQKLENVLFRQVKEKQENDPRIVAANAPEVTEWVPGALVSSLGGAEPSSVFTERLAKATPMTGLADSVYVEGFVRLHGYDLVLELSIVNRTPETLQNILIELCTNGDLKVVEKPQAVTLGPGESTKTVATIKVASTESGVIFGYATFDRKSAADKEWLVLNQIHADVIDYIQPDCAIQETAFKQMWQEFEWENRIVVNTNLTSPDAFLGLLTKHTRMSLVGSADRVAATKSLLATSQFVAVNLYAKSIFGEDALANVSIEKSDSGQLVGSVRIRSRTQGIALSLGDKVNHVQREQKLRGA